MAPRVLFDTPAPDIITEVPDDQLRCLAGAVAVVERDIDPSVSEADDVRTAITGQISKEARMPVNTPPPCVITEVPDDQLRCLEGAVAVVERDINPSVSEADNVRTAITGQISKEARMLFYTPRARGPANLVDLAVGSTVHGVMSVRSRDDEESIKKWVLARC